MKARGWAVLATSAVLFLLAGCVEAAPPRRVAVVAPPVVVRVAPPLPRVEVAAACPGPAYVWVRGYWAWGARGYAWVPGRWTPRPHRRAVWVDGSWRRFRGGWVWRPGHWR